MANIQPLLILSFGDSLTEGYSQHGLKITPYSKWMKEELEAELGGEYDVEVVTRGASGECVIGNLEGVRREGGFEERMRAEYSIVNADQDPYDWVVFLGGTNDLGWGKEVSPLWEAILKVTDIPLKEGARVLLMTVPESKAKYRVLDERRRDLNARMRGDEREGVYIFDLNKKITYHDMSEEERSEIWDDGLHFSEKGYEKLGRLVAERLVGILEGKEGRIESGFDVAVQSRFEEIEEDEKDG